MGDALLIVNRALVSAPGGGLLTTAGGASCCCNPCSAYYKGVRCGPSTECTQAPDSVYVCISFICNGGGGLTPTRNVVNVGGGICYQFNLSVTYPTIPTGSTVLTQGNCQPDCTGCSLPSLYYGVRRCGCSNGPGTYQIYVPCDCYWAAKRAGMQCPVVRTASGECFEVVPGFGYPGPPPAGTEVLCPSADGCCACCPTCYQYTQVVGSWQCPAAGIVGELKTCCCGDNFIINGNIREEQYQADGGVMYLMLVRTWEFKNLGPCNGPPGGSERGSLVFKQFAAPFTGGQLQFQFQIVEDCTDEGCRPAPRSIPIGGGGREILNIGSGGPFGSGLLLGCSVPSETVVTDAALTCNTYKGQQVATKTDGSSKRVVRFSLVVGAIEGDRCGMGCVPNPGDGAVSVPTGGGCSGCGGGTKGLTI